MYQPGKMGMAEGLSLVFIITFVPVFLSVWSVTVDRNTSATWIVSVINGLLAMAVSLGVLWVLQRYSLDYLDVCEYFFGKTSMWIIGMIYAIQFLSEAIFLLREFSENTLLTALPTADFSFIIFIFIGVTLLLIFLGIESIARTSYIILPFISLSLVLIAILLSNKFVFLHIAPWLGPGITKLLISGVEVSGFNFGLLLIPLLGYSFQNTSSMKRACIFGFGLSMVFRITMVLTYLFTFGSTVGREKVLPFFEMTRLVSVSPYLQRIEALFIIIWVMAGVLAIAINLYVSMIIMARLFRLPNIKPMFIPLGLVVAEIAMIPEDITTVITTHSKAMATIYNIGAVGIPLLIILTALLKGEHGKRCSNGEIL
ncbi:spore germination protein [Sporomusa sphaeroides DSM 2875]|uniref:GerAB/ArcD/ProY family transporter n=1 Tax=Sporomusa sphaeroides TaxID=47679 RepID=UPI00202DF959|nr:GerAB/ArcD/ProY family transporter [Sporomusa sphaeroides]MCM0759791.1 spore germination protein [Sporomusa sphaeroides DSM 2875]